MVYNYLVENYGIEFAKKYYKANQEAIEDIQKNIIEENIECDFERKSAYVFTQDAKEVEKIKQEVKAVKAIGGKAEFEKNIKLKLKDVKRWYRISEPSTI